MLSRRGLIHCAATELSAEAHPGHRSCRRGRQHRSHGEIGRPEDGRAPRAGRHRRKPAGRQRDHRHRRRRKIGARRLHHAACRTGLDRGPAAPAKAALQRGERPRAGVATPLILVVHPSLPAQTLKELIGLATARPGQLSYASAGSGGVQRLAAELLKATTKIDIVHIPYKGAGPVMQDLVGGQVQMFFAGMPPAMPHVRSGKLRALAVTTTTRSSAAAEVPTMEEAGVPRFDISNWFAYFVPSGTPQDVIARLNGEIVRALKQQDVREKLAAAGADALGTSPDELATFMRSESRKFAELIKVSGARLD